MEYWFTPSIRRYQGCFDNHYHIHCSLMVRTSLQVQEIPSPKFESRWSILFLFFCYCGGDHQSICTVGGAWVWLFLAFQCWKACFFLTASCGAFWTLFFLLSVSRSVPHYKLSRKTKRKVHYYDDLKLDLGHDFLWACRMEHDLLIHALLSYSTMFSTHALCEALLCDMRTHARDDLYPICSNCMWLHCSLIPRYHSLLCSAAHWKTCLIWKLCSSYRQIILLSYTICEEWKAKFHSWRNR